MKKKYEAPKLEIKNFTITKDILGISLEDWGSGGFTDEIRAKPDKPISTSGFGW